MNERIKELAEQAEYQEDMFGIGHWDMPECKKFTKLIVQECMNIIVQNRKYASEHNWPAVELANVCLYEIDKTFGVHEDGKETVSS